MTQADLTPLTCLPLICRPPKLRPVCPSPPARLDPEQAGRPFLRLSRRALPPRQSTYPPETDGTPPSISARSRRTSRIRSTARFGRTCPRSLASPRPSWPSGTPSHTSSPSASLPSPPSPPLLPLPQPRACHRPACSTPSTRRLPSARSASCTASTRSRSSASSSPIMRSRASLPVEDMPSGRRGPRSASRSS